MLRLRQVQNIWDSRCIRMVPLSLACVKHSSCCAWNSHRSQPLIKEDMTLTVTFKYEHRQSTTPISNLMSSSPALSNRDPSRWEDSNDSSPESSICDCQSQLKHYDMNGDPHKDLRDACKRSMGIPVEDASATESDPEWGFQTGTL